MNIFYLDHDIRLCSQYHCDKHVVKMILEYTQILCTVIQKTGELAPYKPTHSNHPCTQWAGESIENWIWLKKLCLELHNEYQFRFGENKQHKSFLIAKDLIPPRIPSLGLIEHPQAMPDKYKVINNPVSAYRNYYLGEKSHLLKYTKRKYPNWI